VVLGPARRRGSAIKQLLEFVAWRTTTRPATVPVVQMVCQEEVRAGVEVLQELQVDAPAVPRHRARVGRASRARRLVHLQVAGCKTGALETVGLLGHVEGFGRAARAALSLRAGVAFLAEHGSEGACASDEDEHGASASDEDDRSPHRPRRVASDDDAPCPLCLNVPLPYRQSTSSAPP